MSANQRVPWVQCALHIYMYFRGSHIDLEDATAHHRSVFKHKSPSSLPIPPYHTPTVFVMDAANPHLNHLRRRPIRIRFLGYLTLTVVWMWAYNMGYIDMWMYMSLLGYFRRGIFRRKPFKIWGLANLALGAVTVLAYKAGYIELWMHTLFFNIVLAIYGVPVAALWCLWESE